MRNTTRHLPDFIDHNRIESALAGARSSRKDDSLRIRDILEKAEAKAGLSMEEAACLLRAEAPDDAQAILETASRLKKAIYGNRLVLFAPLYITNECCNRCLYCGFQDTNTKLERRTLTDDELREEVRILEAQGQKRLLLVYGEHPTLGAEWIARTMRTVYETSSGDYGQIRRVNVNCAPLSVEDFRILKAEGIGTYQCFQETYHRPTYAAMHLRGPKSDYLWRLYALHRAMEAGIDDVGMGPLFGLHDPDYELLATLNHAAQLEKDCGVGPHTVSFPRLEPALGADVANRPPHALTDEHFTRIVAVLRLALPYTGLILSTRESAPLRTRLIEVGVSQISAASRTYPGGYADAQRAASQNRNRPACDSHAADHLSSNSGRPQAQQFATGDHRSLDEVVHDIVANHGYLPSWCTACYRAGRTGDHFMDLAKTGGIQKFCHPNSLLTFQEYLLDYASPQTRTEGEQLIKRELEAQPESRRQKLQSLLARIRNGERDLYI
ncbi:[FeFe] hydrogenase H-cluster radical SAM maturase HydG [Desulfovibrio mangrovi]|uniref:[FeFe] hydrogenase H-cluster radical SAM maturase HydG n=1 Tax=Desulfovibrio mangrovi TaxID=2976983 RepID=UPI0022459417|nr:[FeFe] hydrogenase H-cluster radical SAM maturase HydG [Desulfovibrio mangrovi]UZP68950.1 [FeFe] hydrogenase H-cluster radical SAM maturase HydG [Desulfovibrio mangrovi]